GGSYFMEALTDEMERQAEAYFKRIDEIGGVIPAIELGFFQKEIADAAFRYQKELEQKRRVVVGVNDFVVDEEEPIEILRIDPRLESEQVERVRTVRRKRDQAKCAQALNQLRKAAAGTDNLMPYMLDAALQEDAQVIGLSIHSGAHMTLFPAVVEELKRRKATDIVVFGGGIIPDDDIAALKKRGVEKIFTPGTPLQDIVEWLRKRFPETSTQ